MPRPTRALVPLLLSLLYVVSSAGSASAADGYKYWNYFHVEDGAYAFATTGPADFVPEDGAVEAYRYGLSTAADGLQPRTEATTYTVDDLCEGQEAKAGEKRVGVLLDYGTPADSDGAAPEEPRGACALVAEDANGQQVLDAVADVRAEGGLVCGVDGYPAKGCSVTVKDPEAAADEPTVEFALPQQAAADGAATAESSDEASEASEDGDDGAPWTLIGVGVAVIVIGGAAFALSRRGKTA